MWLHAFAAHKFINIRIQLARKGVALYCVYSFVIRTGLAQTRTGEGVGGRTSAAMRGRLTAGRGLCAPRVISNVPGYRDSTLMERVALTPAFARQARRSSGVVRARACLSLFRPTTNGSVGSLVNHCAESRPRESLDERETRDSFLIKKC